MTWTVKTIRRDEGISDVTATFTNPNNTTDVFTFNSTIKDADADGFTQKVLAVLAEHQAKKTKENTLKDTLEAILNSEKV